MDEVRERQIGLPIRLAPSRQAAIFGVLFMVFWLGILVFISSKMVPNAIRNLENFREDPTTILFLLVPAIMFCMGLPMLAFFASRFLPGSPFDYLSIREVGVTRRLVWKVKEARWPEIHQFDCIERTRKTKNGSQKYWLVMAEGVGGTARDADQRVKEALLSFDSGTFAPAFKDKAEFAALLTRWLNNLLPEIHAGKLRGPVSVPAPLADAVRICAEPGSGNRSRTGPIAAEPSKDKTVQAARRKSVIER